MQTPGKKKACVAASARVGTLSQNGYGAGRCSRSGSPLACKALQCQTKWARTGQPFHRRGWGKFAGCPRMDVFELQKLKPQAPFLQDFFFSPSACGVGGVGEWGRGGAGASEGTHPLASRKLRVGTPCCHIAAIVMASLVGFKEIAVVDAAKTRKKRCKPPWVGWGKHCKIQSKPLSLM